MKTAGRWVFYLARFLLLAALLLVALLPQDEAVNADGWQVSLLCLSTGSSTHRALRAAVLTSCAATHPATHLPTPALFFTCRCNRRASTSSTCPFQTTSAPQRPMPGLPVPRCAACNTALFLYVWSDRFSAAENDAGFAGTAVCCMQYCCCLCAFVEQVQQQKQMPGLPAPRCVACCCPLPSIGGKTARHAQTADPAQHVRLPVAVSGGTGAAARHACNHVAAALSAVVWQDTARLHPAVVRSCGL